MDKNPYRIYQENQIKTADQGRLILILYEEAIKSLELGKDKLLRKDYGEKTKLLNKAENIVCELMSSLNMEAGEVAYSLQSLYSYLVRRIFHANIRRDLEAIEEVINLLKELQEAWSSIITKPIKGLENFRNKEFTLDQTGGRQISISQYSR